MPYSNSPNNPMVTLGNTANTIINQYNSKQITLEQFKTAVQSQIVSQLNTLDMTRPADDSYYLISTAIAMTGAQD